MRTFIDLNIQTFQIEKDLLLPISCNSSLYTFNNLLYKYLFSRAKLEIIDRGDVQVGGEEDILSAEFMQATDVLELEKYQLT